MSDTEIVNVEKELRNENCRFFQEKLHDDVVNIIQQWKMNSADLDYQFKGRTYTKAKRKLPSLTQNEIQEAQKSMNSPNINLHIGGLVTSVDKNFLLDVSPPNSIFTSSNYNVDSSMANSLITSMDFRDVDKYIDSNQIDDNQDLLDEELLKLKLNFNQKLENSLITSSDFRNLSVMENSDELDEKFLTMNLISDNKYKIPSCSSEDMNSEETLDSPSPVLSDNKNNTFNIDLNTTKILHNNINLDNTYNLLNFSDKINKSLEQKNRTLTLNKKLNSTIQLESSIDIEENIENFSSTPIREKSLSETIIMNNIDEELQFSPVPKPDLSIPKNIEKIRNKLSHYSSNNNTCMLEKSHETLKEFNYSPPVQNSKLLKRRNRLYDDVEVPDVAKTLNVDDMKHNFAQKPIQTVKESNQIKLETNAQENPNLNEKGDKENYKEINAFMNETIDIKKSDDIKDLNQMPAVVRPPKLSLLKKRTERDTSADRQLQYPKFGATFLKQPESRLKKPLNRDLSAVVAQQKSEEDLAANSNNIQRASSANDISSNKVTQPHLEAQTLEAKSKSFKNLSSNLNQGYAKRSSLVAPTKFNFAAPNLVKKPASIFQKEVPKNQIQKSIVIPTDNSSIATTMALKTQIPQPSKLRRSGLPRPQKFH